jgi:quercetin dioxygenase-like cupin family protein
LKTVSEESTQSDESTDTRVEGAIKAGKTGDGFFFDLDELSTIDAGPHYSTAHGPVIEGERMQIGMIHKPEGTGSRLHKHDNEQFNYVVKGTLRVKIEDNDPVDVKEGQVAYIPPDTEHWSRAKPGDGEVYFYVVKDAAQGIIGDPIDDSKAEAHYDPGYEPDDE